MKFTTLFCLWAIMQFSFGCGESKKLNAYSDVEGEAALDNGEDAEPVGMVLEVSPHEMSVSLANVGVFAAIARYANGSTEVVTSKVKWSVSDSKIAKAETKDANLGHISTLKPGTVKVKAEYLGKHAEAAFTVNNATLNSINITSNEMTIPKGSVQQFRAIGLYSDASTQDITEQVEWSTINADLISVSNTASSKGLVKGLATGQAEVKVQLNGISSSVSVTVKALLLTKLTVTPNNSTKIVGESFQFKAEGTFSDGSIVDLTKNNVVWTSAVPSLASVVANTGEAKCLVVGVATIVASYMGQAAVTTITIKAAPVVVLNSVEIAGVASVGKGKSVTYTATGKYSDGTSVNVSASAGAVWKSLDTTVATVVGGTVTGWKAGSTKIEFSFGGKTVQKAITIEPADCVPGLVSNTLNFENLAEGLFISGTAASDLYTQYGVKFTNIGLTKLRVAKVALAGEAEPGFLAWPSSACSGTPKNNRICAVGSVPKPVGRRVLSSDNALNTTTLGFQIEYVTPVSKLEFDLVDHSLGETWTIKVYNAAGAAIDTTTLVSGSLLGVDLWKNSTTHFSITRSTAEISKVVFSGKKLTTDFGFAMDNFLTGLNVCQ